MLILSLDSAGAACGACLWLDKKIIASIIEPMDRGQDQRLMPIVLDVMKQAGIAFDNLDRIAVTRGPGSFTGLRIGLAAARGIGLAANKPVIGIDRFSIYYEMFRARNKDVLVLIDSKRKELFCRFYPATGPAVKLTMMPAEDIAHFLKDKKDIIVTGDVAPDGINNFQDPPEKEIVICAVLAAAVTDVIDPAFLPRPLYLRAPDVTIKQK